MCGAYHHDSLRCIVNIFRLEIGASFFLIPRTKLFCLALLTSMVFRFVPLVPTSVHTSPALLLTHTFTTFPPFPPTPLTRTIPSPLTIPSTVKYRCLRWLFRRRHLGRQLLVLILQSLRNLCVIYDLWRVQRLLETVVALLALSGHSYKPVWFLQLLVAVAIPANISGRWIMISGTKLVLLFTHSLLLWSF